MTRKRTEDDEPESLDSLKMRLGNIIKKKREIGEKIADLERTYVKRKGVYGASTFAEDEAESLALLKMRLWKILKKRRDIREKITKLENALKELDEETSEIAYKASQYGYNFPEFVIEVEKEHV